MSNKRVSEMTEAEIRQMVAPRLDEKVYVIADMIADWFGRHTIDADRDLAVQIIARLLGEDAIHTEYRDLTYGWRTDERA